MRITAEDRNAYVLTAQISWALVGLMLTASLAIVWMTDLEYQLDVVPRHGILGCILLVVAVFYTYIRFDPTVMRVSNALALLALTPLCSGIFVKATTYMGGAFGFQDRSLLFFDQAVGFDWLTYLSWANAHTDVSWFLSTAYNSAEPQGIFLFLYAVLLRKHTRFQVVFLAFQISLAISCIVAMVVPTLGPYLLLGISPEVDHSNISLTTMNSHVPHVLALREPDAVALQSTIAALITFPSMHTVFAILFAWFFWADRLLRWPILLLNAVMLAATPLWGSHYLADMVAGAIAAVAALMAAMWVRSASEARRSAFRWPTTLGALPAHPALALCAPPPQSLGGPRRPPPMARREPRPA